MLYILYIAYMTYNKEAAREALDVDLQRMIAAKVLGDETGVYLELEAGEDNTYFRMWINSGRIDPQGLIRLMTLGYVVYNIVAVDNRLLINLQKFTH